MTRYLSSSSADIYDCVYARAPHIYTHTHTHYERATSCVLAQDVLENETRKSRDRIAQAGAVTALVCAMGRLRSIHRASKLSRFTFYSFYVVSGRCTRTWWPSWERKGDRKGKIARRGKTSPSKIITAVLPFRPPEPTGESFFFFLVHKSDSRFNTDITLLSITCV